MYSQIEAAKRTLVVRNFPEWATAADRELTVAEALKENNLGYLEWDLTTTQMEGTDGKKFLAPISILTVPTYSARKKVMVDACSRAVVRYWHEVKDEAGHEIRILFGFSGLRNVPFGDEVQTHTHHTHDHTPNTTPHHQPHTRSQHKRSLRSRDARQRRAQQRIHNRATHRRNYRSWRSALTPTPYTLCCPKVRAPWANPTNKSLYTTSPAALPHTGTAAAKQAEAAVHHNPTITGHSQQHPPVPSIPTIPAESLQDEAEAPTEPQHPNHLRTDTRPAPQNRQQRQDRHDTKQRQHTRAHWFKTHIAQPSKKGRTKHDVQTTTQHHLRGAFWNTTGLLEAAKLHTLIDIMRKHRLSWLALTETHIKQPDQIMIDGYTITHSATEEYDSKGQPMQTFTGVSLITAPHLTPTITDLTCIDGRFLRFTIDTVEAPLSILAVYAPHNQREQPCRDKFWQPHSSPLTESEHLYWWSGISTHLPSTSWPPSHTPRAPTLSQAKLPKRTNPTTQQRATPTKDSFTTSWPHRTTASHRAGCKKLHKTDTPTKDPTET